MPYCVDCGLILELARLYFCYVLLTVGVRLVDDFKQCCSLAANNMAVLAIWLVDCLCVFKYDGLDSFLQGRCHVRTTLRRLALFCIDL